MSKINDLFEKDSVIRVISVLIAIFIWFLVLDKENPFEERSLSIPLSNNAQVLRQNNLQLVGNTLPLTLDIKIRGRSNKVRAVTANDFKASIDLSGITSPGTRTINIDMPEYHGDEDIFITAVNPSSVTLTFERIIGKQYPVNIEFTGKLPAGYELVNLSVEPANVVLEELESSITKVDKVVAKVNLDEIGDTGELIMRGIALDAEGQPIRQFEGQIPVIVRFDLAKRVPVVAATRGRPGDDYYLKEVRYSLPGIRVIGKKSVLEGITKVNAEAVDITGKTSTFQVPLTLITPNDTKIMDSDAEQLTAEIVIEKLATRTFNVPARQISIYGSDMSGTRVYRVTNDPIPITIKGTPEAVNGVKTTDIVLSVQVNGFEDGRHEIPLMVKLPVDVTLVGEYTVEIVIESTTTETSTTPTPNP
ncbi:MAG: hypothetical protein GXX10_04795 [Clostridiaceae bacterium]|nr:hypothetical protein [Clostridiaceae bacterium]